MTWEEAVKELRNNPDNKQAIIDNYFDANIRTAVERFRGSEECTALLKLIPTSAKNILDIGAGRGMASYAFAKNNLHVTALEPDPSNDVGAGAIREIAATYNLPIAVVETFGETLPFDDNTFDVVYVRQVLHHAQDLAQFCKEAKRVLKPKGIFIATREHVLSHENDLQTFLDHHPLHHLYGGEHAYTLLFYIQCIEQAGLTITNLIQPYASVINFAPVSIADMRKNFSRKLTPILGNTLAEKLIAIPQVYQFFARLKSKQDNAPGRLYSFVCTKP